jgi:hypothetical protein
MPAADRLRSARRRGLRPIRATWPYMALSTR